MSKTSEKGNEIKVRLRSFSSSAVENEPDSDTLTSEFGARKECDNRNERDAINELYIDPMTILPQRRGSSPSKLSTDQSNRLSPPIVRVNSPPNNDDLDAVEKQLGDMLEATIASIESGAKMLPMKSMEDKFVFRGGDQDGNIDDDDSPLSYFTGSFNYFFRPKDRYKNYSYHQPAQYSSWSSNISNNVESERNTTSQRRVNLKSIGRAKSLEPSWTTDVNPTHNVDIIQSDFPSSPLSTETSGFDTEDQIDEYMMMLHSNPELFLASVRKGCISSEVKNIINGNGLSSKRSSNRKPTMKDLGRAQTLEPSWTPDTAPTKHFLDNNKNDTQYCGTRYFIDRNAKIMDSINPYTEVRSTQSFPGTEFHSSYPDIPNNMYSSSSNEARVPSIIVSPPSSLERFLSDFESVSPSYVYHKRFRSKSLAPYVPIDELSSTRSESIKLRKFLSQGNLRATSALPLSSRELPSRVLFENTEKRRYIDRYYMSIISRIFYLIVHEYFQALTPTMSSCTYHHHLLNG